MDDQEQPQVLDELQPVPVAGTMRLAGAAVTHEEAPEFGSYATYAFLGTVGEQPIKVLPRDPNRTYAQITVVIGPGPAWMGSVAQCGAIVANPASGAGGHLLVLGQPPVPIRHQEEVWVVSDQVHACTISVVAERRRSR
jgi:hypothetical protein